MSELASDILRSILLYLTPLQDFYAVSLVNRQWSTLCNNENFWKECSLLVFGEREKLVGVHWKAEYRKYVRWRQQRPCVTVRHNDEVLNVQFSHKGDTLVTLSRDGTASVCSLSLKAMAERVAMTNYEQKIKRDSSSSSSSSSASGRSSSGSNGDSSSGAVQEQPTATVAATPAADMGDWREAKDPRTGKSYWYDNVTKKTTWKNPLEEAEPKKSAARVASPTAAAAAASLAAEEAVSDSEEEKKGSGEPEEDIRPYDRYGWVKRTMYVDFPQPCIGHWASFSSDDSCLLLQGNSEVDGRGYVLFFKKREDGEGYKDEYHYIAARPGYFYSDWVSSSLPGPPQFVHSDCDSHGRQAFTLMSMNQGNLSARAFILPRLKTGLEACWFLVAPEENSFKRTLIFDNAFLESHHIVYLIRHVDIEDQTNDDIVCEGPIEQYEVNGMIVGLKLSQDQQHLLLTYRPFAKHQPSSSSSLSSAVVTDLATSSSSSSSSPTISTSTQGQNDTNEGNRGLNEVSEEKELQQQKGEKDGEGKEDKKEAEDIAMEDEEELEMMRGLEAKRAILKQLHIRVYRVRDMSVIYEGHGARSVTPASCPFLSIPDSSGDNIFLAGDENKQVHVWASGYSQPIATLKGHTKVVNAIACHPVHREIFASAGDDHICHLWLPDLKSTSIG